jgi:NAD+ kinase
MTSTTGSVTLSPKAVQRAAVVTHGKPQTIGPALARLANVAREAGVELRMGHEEAERHGLEPTNGDGSDVDIAVVLGGDGTMLRAMTRFLGTGIPVIGVNFGRVGFLSSISRADLETQLARVFAGDYVVTELPTLDVVVGDEHRVAVNDLVVSSAIVGRMIQLEWAVGGESLGRLAGGGVVFATPTG